MIEAVTKNQMAIVIFRALESVGSSNVVLHHFDFEEGGDIDFCCERHDLDEFLRSLRECLLVEHWRVIQVLEHEQSAAYIVCGAEEDSSDFLILDYCEDYRVRGHVVLSQREILKNQRNLAWDWTDPSVEDALLCLRKSFKKRRWSFAELKLKLRRLLKPRGLLVECPEDVRESLENSVSACFRKVVAEPNSLLGVFGSTLILMQPDKVGALRKWILTKMNCWLKASSEDEVRQFLVKRTAFYYGWEQDV